MSDSVVEIYVCVWKTVKEKGPFDDDWQIMTELSPLVFKTEIFSSV